MTAFASLHDLSAQAVGELATYVASSADPPRRLQGRVVAVLPFGPTVLSSAAWIAAATRLGAGVLRASDFDAGESDPFDLVEQAGRWADLLVTSHPLNGFARAAAERTGRPVVDAGEPDGEDPAGGLSLVAAALGAQATPPPTPLRAAVCGDLAGSRSARSLLAALAALGASVLLVPAKGRELSEAEVSRLARRTGRRPLRFEARSMRSLLDMVDTVLLSREGAPQLPLFREIGMPPGEAERRARREVEDLDLLFVAGGDRPDRLVREPFRGRRRTAAPAGAEHATSPRAVEAVLLHAAGDLGAPDPEVGAAEGLVRLRSPIGLTCRGERCVGARERDRVAPDFVAFSRPPRDLECRYCGRPATAAFAGSRLEGLYHPIDSASARAIRDANLVLFASAAEARGRGFEPARGAARPESA